jgi:predicted esterase
MLAALWFSSLCSVRCSDVAAPSKVSVPAGCWDAARAEKLEKAIDTFFAESDTSKRAQLFHDDPAFKDNGLTLEEFEAMTKAAPPEGEKRGDIYRVPCPWDKVNPRAWFNLALPANYSPRKACGLVVSLHGSGSDGDNLPSFYTPQLNNADFIILYPTTLNIEHMWNAPDEMANVYRIMEWALRHYRIDARRLVITGGSMGGMGTWTHLLARAELWSAGASVAGHPAAQGDVLEKLRGIPFYILHGEKDTNGASLAPVEHVRAAVEELKKRKIDCVYVEAPGAGHTPPMNFWQDMNKWIAAQALKPFSPRPLLLPPAGKHSLAQNVLDPGGFQDDPATALLNEHKYKEAKDLLDARLAKDGNDARGFLLRALAEVPALHDGFPADLDPKALVDGQHGWGAATESAALADLTRALAIKTEKGDKPEIFDASVHVQFARIYAKRFVTTLNNPSVWIGNYNNCTRELMLIQKTNPDNPDLYPLAQAVKARTPSRPATGSKP